MDKIPVCGTGAPGSTPGESTNRQARNTDVFRAFAVCSSRSKMLGHLASGVEAPDDVL